MTRVETCPDCGGDLLPDAILTKLRCPSCEPAAPLPAPEQPAFPAPGWYQLPNVNFWHRWDGTSADSICGEVWIPPSLRGLAPAEMPPFNQPGQPRVTGCSRCVASLLRSVLEGTP